MSKEIEKHKDPYRRTVAFSLVVLIVFLAFMIVRPFLIAIFSAGALAYIFYPLYKHILKNYLKKETLAAIATCAIIILVVLMPMIFLTTVLTYELRDGYIYVREFLKVQNMRDLPLPSFITQMLGDPEQLKALIIDVATQLVGWLQGVIKAIPNVILNIFVTVFSAYYFLKNGRDIYSFSKSVFPLPEGRYEQILKRFDDLSRSMVSGQIVVAFVQGILAWIGFFFLGVPNPTLWAFLTIIISVIPLLGAAIIWVPIVVYLFSISYVTHEYSRPISLLIYGTFVISLIDNVLKPKIVGDRANIHPLVILFGILGGIQIFGIPGILIGPLILTLLDIVVETYRETL